MGSTQSVQAQSSPTQMTAEEMQLKQIEQSMPRYSRPETFEEKLYRKFSKEPLVPIGCLTTAYFLGSGIRSFYNRDAGRSQQMMRARVAAQFTTLMIFIGYAGLNAFNLDIAPGYHSKPDQKKE